LLNWRRRGKRYRREKKVKIIGRKDLGEQPIKFKDIIDVRSIPVRDRMDQRGH
jgi:hypothetical protein